MQGSAEALQDALDEAIVPTKCQVKVIASGVGGITESDVQLAAASQGAASSASTCVPTRAARDAIKETGRRRPLLQHHLRGDRRHQAAALPACSRPKIKEQIVGLAEVREVFRSPKFGNVAGCMVIEGYVGAATRCACCATTS